MPYPTTVFIGLAGFYTRAMGYCPKEVTVIKSATEWKHNIYYNIIAPPPATLSQTDLLTWAEKNRNELSWTDGTLAFSL